MEKSHGILSEKHIAKRSTTFTTHNTHPHAKNSFHGTKKTRWPSFDSRIFTFSSAVPPKEVEPRGRARDNFPSTSRVDGSGALARPAHSCAGIHDRPSRPRGRGSEQQRVGRPHCRVEASREEQLRSVCSLYPGGSVPSDLDTASPPTTPEGCASAAAIPPPHWSIRSTGTRSRVSPTSTVAHSGEKESTLDDAKNPWATNRRGPLPHGANETAVTTETRHGEHWRSEKGRGGIRRGASFEWKSPRESLSPLAPSTLLVYPLLPPPSNSILQGDSYPSFFSLHFALCSVLRLPLPPSPSLCLSLSLSSLSITVRLSGVALLEPLHLRFFLLLQHVTRQVYIALAGSPA